MTATLGEIHERSRNGLVDLFARHYNLLKVFAVQNN